MGKKPKTSRYTIDEFCLAHRIKHSEFADFLGVKPQQVNNWKIANEKRRPIDGKDAYIVELNIESRKVCVIKNEKIMNYFKVEVLPS